MPICGNRRGAIYGNRYFLYMGAVGTCESGRVLICTSLSHVSKGLRNRHSGVRESHVMLSYVCESLRDRRWSASCSLALRYKFARLLQRKQSQFSSSVSLYSPFSFSILLYSLFCTRLYCCNTLVIPCLHYYIWRSQRDHRK